MSEEWDDLESNLAADHHALAFIATGLRAQCATQREKLKNQRDEIARLNAELDKSKSLNALFSEKLREHRAKFSEVVAQGEFNELCLHRTIEELEGHRRLMIATVNTIMNEVCTREQREHIKNGKVVIHGLTLAERLTKRVAEGATDHLERKTFPDLHSNESPSDQQSRRPK